MDTIQQSISQPSRKILLLEFARWNRTLRTIGRNYLAVVTMATTRRELTEASVSSIARTDPNRSHPRNAPMMTVIRTAWKTIRARTTKEFRSSGLVQVSTRPISRDTTRLLVRSGVARIDPDLEPAQSKSSRPVTANGSLTTGGLKAITVAQRTNRRRTFRRHLKRQTVLKPEGIGFFDKRDKDFPLSAFIRSIYVLLVSTEKTRS
jgi:hypothetical protein